MNALFCTHLFEAGHKRTINQITGASLVEKLAIILLRKHTNNNFYFVIFRVFF